MTTTFVAPILFDDERIPPVFSDLLSQPHIAPLRHFLFGLFIVPRRDLFRKAFVFPPSLYRDGLCIR